jgi:hypothetical protein
MATTIRTRASLSFRQHWNGNPCAFIGDLDVVKSRPAVDPASDGEIVT